MHKSVWTAFNYSKLAPSSSRRWSLVCATAAIMGAFWTANLHADETWADPTISGLWTVPANWSGNAVPTNTDNVFAVGNGSNTITAAGGGSPGTFFRIENLSVNNTTLNIVNGASFQADDVTVAGTGAGFTTLQTDDPGAGTVLSIHNLTVTGTASSQNFVDLNSAFTISGAIVLGGTGAFNDNMDVTADPGSVVAPSSLSIASNGTFFTEYSGDFTVNTVYSGSGEIAEGGGGVMTLQGDGSAFTGTLMSEEGTLNIQSASLLAHAQSFLFDVNLNTSTIEIGATATSSSTAVIDLSNASGIIQVDSGVAFHFTGTITDGGAGTVLTKTGDGQFLFSGGGITFSGETIVNAGYFGIEQNSVLGDGSITSTAVVNGGELHIDQFSFLNVQNVTVNTGGILTVNGSAGSATPATINILGGTLKGFGTISSPGNQATVIVGDGTGTGGTLSVSNPVTPTTDPVPPNLVGNLTIDGSLVLHSDATTVLKVPGTTHGNNAAFVAGVDYDHVQVNGLAQLGGTLVVQAAAGVVQPGDKFDFITAQSFDPAHDTFDTVNVLNNALTFTQSIQNAGTDYELSLIATQNTFATFATTPNQLAIANALNTQFANLGNTPIIIALDNIPGSALPNALEQISPQPLQVFGHIAFDNASFSSSQLNNHLANLRDGLTGFDGSQLTINDTSLSAPLSQIKGRLLAWNPASTPGLISDSVNPIFGGMDIHADDSNRDPWSTFISGNVILADLSHNQDLTHQDYTTGTISLGADYRLDRHFTIGSMLSYAHTDTNLDHNGSSATVDSYSPALYASYVDGGWYGNGLFAYDYNSYTEDRNVDIGAPIAGVRGGLLNGTNHGASQGNQFTGNLTGGYEFQRSGWKFGPVVSAQYSNLGIDAFSEQGPTALNIADQGAESFRTQVGVEARYALRAGSIYLTPHASLSWQHEFLDDSRGITSSFNGSGAGSFTVATSSPDRDSAFIDVGLNADVTHSVTLFTDYTIQAGQSDFFAQSVQAGVKVSF